MQPKDEPAPTPVPNEEAPRGPRCFRCLLSETDHTLYETVRAYIDSLSPELRVPDALYRERLAACTSCKNLINGLCGLCGCFVEARAAKTGSRCPAAAPRW